MTKYRLKDAELQKKLDEISDGDFSKRLNEQKLAGCSSDFAFSLEFGKTVSYYHHRFSIVIQVNEVQINEEYDANKWNSYPKVIPQGNVPLRLEIWRTRKGRREVTRISAKYIYSRFYDSYGQIIHISKEDAVLFKLWE